MFQSFSIGAIRLTRNSEGLKSTWNNPKYYDKKGWNIARVIKTQHNPLPEKMLKHWIGLPGWM